ncbi:MAG: hypothetical protein EOP09_01760 [Proteobacteria bacterium]|nr:MAG: hypothetical protein EOP09_01760 [Pseudomonadota bacterium]
MTRNMFIYPYEQNSKEYGELLGTYNSTFNSVKAEGKSEAEAKRIAKTTVCVAGMQSPQFWLGNSGPLDVLRKTAVEVGRRIPTAADYSAFASASNKQVWIKSYVRDLQSSDGYQAAVKYWHQDWLGTRPFSQTMDPRTNGQNDANYASNGASRIMGYSQATLTKVPASGSPLDGQTIMGLNGKSDIVHNSEQCSKTLQPFDPRTTKLVWEQKNPAVGGNYETIASLEKRNGTWVTLPGSITLNNGSKLVTGLADINLAQTNAGTNINGGAGFRYAMGKLVNSPLQVFNASDRRLRRFSPSGEQNGYSEIKTFYAGQTVYACNTTTRFALTCAYRPGLNAPEKPTTNYTYDESKRGNSSLAAWNAEGHANINANGSYTTRVPRPLVGYHTMLDTFADPRILEQMRCGTPDMSEASYAGLSNFREDVAYPKGFDNEQSTSAPDQNGLNEIAINPFYRDEFIKEGAEKLAMDKIMSDMSQDASRLIAHVVSSGTDYRQILLADYTFGTDYTKLTLATQSFFLPFRAPQAELGNSPDSVKKITQASLGTLNRRWFQSSQNSNSLPGSWQAFLNNGSLNRSGDVIQPKPIQGILTTAELLGPVSPGIRTVSSRIITRLSCSGVNTYNPTGSTAALHTKYVTQKTHLQTTCLSCHINLDPLASALNVNFAANPNISSGGALGTELDIQGGAKYGFRGIQNPGDGAFLGKPVRGLAGVADVLANSDEFARCTVSKAFENIFGRAVPSKADCGTAPNHPDCLLVEATAAKFKSSLGYNYNEMIQELASSSLNLKGN